MNLNYNDRLSEAFELEMCIRRMLWGLLYILRGIKLKSFEELAKQAHDMELNMSSSGNEGSPIYEPYKGKDKMEVKKRGRFAPKSEYKEAMNINVSPLKVATKRSMNQSGRTTTF